MYFKYYTVDLLIFARFKFSQNSRGGKIREYKNLVKIVIIKAIRTKINIREF